MKFTRLGRTGLEVSKLCLGCMTFGVPERGSHPWTLDADKTKPLIHKAIESGINFFDTANVYSDGTSEEIVGNILNKYIPREEVVIATKVHGRMRSGPNGAGLSRKAIFQEIDASLKRLKTDYIDLYQIHRWDYNTPIEETMEALHDVIKMGKTRYIGASSMFAWQFAKAQHIAETHRWSRFITMQNQLNLLYREEEREMLPLCADMGVGIMPWSPLARGRLTRDKNDSSIRQNSDEFGKKLYDSTVEADNKVIDAVAEIASNRGVPRAQIALAWVLSKSNQITPIIGASKLEQIDDAISALDIELTKEELTTLESPYIPHAITGFE